MIIKDNKNKKLINEYLKFIEKNGLNIGKIFENIETFENEYKY